MGAESDVRELIEDWLKAVQAGDLADHDDDIVKFDVRLRSWACAEIPRTGGVAALIRLAG